MTRQIIPKLVLAELHECMKIHSYVGMATIAAESVPNRREQTMLIRQAAEMAICFGDKLQANHLVVVRYARRMTPAIRQYYRRMMGK